MRFRLIYDGELRATQREPIDKQKDSLAEHKQAIRKVFHRQLKQLWSTNRFLREHEEHLKREGDDPLPADRRSYRVDHERVPLWEAVARRYQENGYRFVPLVREETSLLCSLRIVFLRRDIPGSLISAGDLDNRIKTLIDTLRRPLNANELRGNETPAGDEDPFYCLLEDDKLVSHLEVETDTLLEALNENIRQARIIITKPYNVTMFNLGFA